MESHWLSYRNSRIHFSRFGSGPRKAICFHGYGEEAGSFIFLGDHAGNEFTFYAIDLPYHGKTEWKDEQYFSQNDLVQIIEEIIPFMNREPVSGSHKLSLIGFSLGGRVALSLCQQIPGQIERLVLLAPDGLKVNFWYWLSTQTWPGKKIFYFTMKNPGWFFGFLNLLNKLRLVNASVFRFVSYYIGDAKARRVLYNRWISLRKLKPRLGKIKSCIRTNQIKVRLVYGRHDRIILSEVGERFRKGIEDHCDMAVIQSGHQVLHENHIRELLPALLH